MPIPLRRRLFLLIVAGLLPLTIMAAISLIALRRQQMRQTEEVGLELARSVANAVDAELRRSTSVLETLATSPRLDDDDVVAFRERAERVLAAQPEWMAIQLADRTGAVWVDTRIQGQTHIPPVVEKESFDRVSRTRAPVVGKLTKHANGLLFAVRVPVFRGNAVKYILSALVDPRAIRDVLIRQDVPEDWLISVVDSEGIRVARSRGHDENLGGRLSDSVQQVVSRGGTEGYGIAYSLEGARIFTPYSRIGWTGWMAVLGIPTSQVDTAAYRSLAVYGLGVILSLALGTLGAIWVARTITGPMSELSSAAESLGHKRVPKPPRTPIEEIRAVGSAITAAGEQLANIEVEREALLRKEREARESAEAADRAKDEFMAVLSHELRTPLNAVYGWARMLQNNQLRDDATIARAKDAIVRNADAQVQLIDDLLDLSRITSGKMRLEVKRVEVQQVLQGAIETVRPAADAKVIALTAKIDPHVGAVTGDPTRLQQVIWNLLMNAVKFTPRGGSVQVEAEAVNTSVRITVSDTGKGISTDILPHVFERFRQADSSSTRTYGGLGLGLSLVKHLVELHGGTVTAESEGEGRGATFTVTLPIALAVLPSGLMPAAPTVGQQIEVSGTVVRLDGLQVLVVDDDAEGLALAEAILSRAGAEVRTCTSAGDALELLEHWKPDVLVSDVEMPGEDGYSLIRRVRSLASDQAMPMPAIALTGYGRPQDRLRAIAAGFNMHVPKPVDPRELTTIVASLAGERHQTISPAP